MTTQESTLQRMCVLVYDRRDKISVMGMCSLAVQRICYNCVFSGLFYHLYPPVKCTMVQIHSPDNQLNVIQGEEFRYINRPCCVSIDMYISDYYLPTFVFWQVCWFDGLYMCDCMCVCACVCLSWWKITHSARTLWHIITKFLTQMYLGLVQKPIDLPNRSNKHPCQNVNFVHTSPSSFPFICWCVIPKVW